MAAQSVSLYFKEGSSDKEYHTELMPCGDGYLVNFRFGRRGAAQTSGTKTKEPLPLVEAKSVYDKLIAEKMKKGYTPGESGAAYQATPLEARFTGVIPQLLNPVDDEDLESLLSDVGFGAQEKKNGKRILVRKNTEGIIGINRNGLVVALPKVVETDILKLLAAGGLVDGELVGKKYFVFDLLELNGRDLRQTACLDRVRQLGELITAELRVISLLDMAQGEQAKRALLARVKAETGEGIVLKELSAPYTPGRPASGGPQRKYKLTAFATCRVEKHSTSKRSASLELLDGSKWLGVGNVGIPANHGIPAIGALVEIEYLYANKGGSLEQAVYHGERDDVPESAATVSQLKYKPVSSEED